MNPKKAYRVLQLVNFYPPFLGAGIRMTHLDKSFRFVDVRLKLRWWNKNLFGTQFGGSLYSMCDPFYAFLVIMRLDGNYIVWDKAASIRFRRPGRGTVYARFEVTDEQVAEILELAEQNERVDYTFKTQIVDNEEKVIAEVEKVVHIRRKKENEK